MCDTTVYWELLEQGLNAYRDDFKLILTKDDYVTRLVSLCGPCRWPALVTPGSKYGDEYDPMEGKPPGTCPSAGWNFRLPGVLCQSARAAGQNPTPWSRLGGSLHGFCWAMAVYEEGLPGMRRSTNPGPISSGKT